MQDESSQVISNNKISERVYRLVLSTSISKFTPGQFVMIRVPSNEVFLRRPFGIAMLDGGELHICYKVVGRGTDILSGLRKDSNVELMGPLGRGFSVHQNKNHILVAGGYGAAPLLGFSGKLVREGKNVHLFYGAKTRKDLFCLDEFESMGVALHISTEDGTLGERGTNIELLKRKIGDIKNPAIRACGPGGMIAALAQFLKGKKFSTEVSLESHMACGLGVCLGCVCKDRDGNYVRVCTEGPVFDVDEINIA